MSVRWDGRERGGCFSHVRRSHISLEQRLGQWEKEKRKLCRKLRKMIKE